MQTNSLVNHESSSVNAIENEEIWELKRGVEDISTSKRFILKALCKAGMVDYEGDEEDRCPLHPKTLHDVEECLVFKELLQDLMNHSQIKISHRRKEEGKVFM